MLHLRLFNHNGCPRNKDRDARRPGEHTQHPYQAEDPPEEEEGTRLEHTRQHELPGSVFLATVLPEHELSRLKVGQPVFVHLEKGANSIVSKIVAVEAEVLSPSTIRRRFDLDDVELPSAVVFALFRPDDMPDGLRAEQYLGSVFQVDVEIGARTPSGISS